MDVRRIFMAVILVGAVSGSHEAMAAGQAGWSGGTTQQPTTNFDRYGQPTTVPSITQRTQTAVTDTGNSLREGLDAGISAGEQTLGVGNTQPQSSYSNRGGSASPWPTTTTANSNLVPIGSPAAPAATGNNWSSIGTGIPAPKLLVPTSPMTNSGTYNSSVLGTTTNFGNAASGASPNGRGPNFPAVAANDQPQMHSVLSDPARSAPAASTTTGDDWMKNWNNQNTTQSTASQPVTIGHNAGNVRDTEIPPLNNGSTMAQDQRGTGASRPSEGWPSTSGSSTDPWGRNGNSQNNTSAFGSPPTTNQQTGAFANQPNSQGMNNGAQPNGPTTNNYTQAGFGTGTMPLGNGQAQNGINSYGRNEFGPNGPMTTQPVFTWVLVVLALAASLAANFYLGASYLDARQKYQSLVRKTAETFRRVKAAAT